MENDIFKIIAARRVQLITTKRHLTTEYKKKLAEIDSELNDLNDVIDTIEKFVQPYVCPVCKGTGYTRRCDAAGQMEDIKCETCHGIGISIKQTD